MLQIFIIWHEVFYDQGRMVPFAYLITAVKGTE